MSAVTYVVMDRATGHFVRQDTMTPLVDQASRFSRDVASNLERAEGYARGERLMLPSPEWVTALERIEILRGGIAASLTILCDDEEARTIDEQMGVECIADWTGFKPVRFLAGTLERAISKAYSAMDKHKQSLELYALADDQFLPPAHGWSCFHCGETFRTVGSARDHFGFAPSADPACRIKAGGERGLVMALRKAENDLAEAWDMIHSEGTEAAKSVRAQASRHSSQIVEAEQAGYDRGLADQAAEIDRLRQIVRRYGDKIGMANAPAELQISIDEAMAAIASEADQRACDKITPVERLVIEQAIGILECEARKEKSEAFRLHCGSQEWKDRDEQALKFSNAAFNLRAIIEADQEQKP